MKKILLIIIASCLLINFNSCNQSCDDIFFSKRVIGESNKELGLIFSLSRPYKINDKCFYNHKLQYWHGDVVGEDVMPYFKWTGRLYSDNQTIYFEQDSGNTFKYFSFNMPLNNYELINVTRNYRVNDKVIEVKHSHYLVREEQFYDSALKDTINKFRFKDFSTNRIGDLVFYIGYKVGIRGVYSGTLLDSTNEEVISHVGDLYPLLSKVRKKKYLNGNLL